MALPTDDRNGEAPGLLRCPRCRSGLAPAPAGTDDVERLACAGCGTLWPVRWGIPDLRGPDVRDPYLALDDDLRAAERLVRRAEGGDFAGTLAAYYEANAKVPPAQARRFIAGAVAAAGRAEAVLAAWQALDGARPGLPKTGEPPAGAPPRTLVDAGSGTGPLAVAALRAGYRTLAIDVGLRFLVLARARARDAGLHLTAVCAGTQALPLADAGVDVMASEYLLENVVPLAPTLGEAARVLRPSGRLWCSTANRWTPGPDPHLGVPWSGWWPGWLAARYARWRGAVPPQRHLLSAPGLRRELRRHGFTDIAVAPAPVSSSQRAGASAAVRRAVDFYDRLAGTSAGRRLLTLVGPALVATCRRDGHAAAS